MKTLAPQAAAAAVAASFLGLASTVWTVPAHAAESRTIVGQGVYTCQSKPNGLPEENYDVTLRISLNAPATVSPGQTVSLSGTATLQFPEKAYQEGKSVGETEADGYSDTLSVATSFNGKTADVPANRWQTAPFPWSDPVVISAPITLHPFTVSSSASGSLKITLPRNERRAPNTATNNPATVAFNGVANNKTAAGNVAENLGCYLQGSSPSVIGTIPITSAPSGAGTTASHTTKASAATASQPQAPSAVPAQSASSGPAGTTIGAPAAGTMPGTAAGTVAENSGTQVSGTPMSAQDGLYATGSPRSGVFVNTNALLLAGGFICIAAVGWALLTQYRLRSIQRAMDDR